MRTKKLLVILLVLVYLIVNVIPVFAAASKFEIDVLPDLLVRGNKLFIYGYYRIFI